MKRNVINIIIFIGGLCILLDHKELLAKANFYDIKVLDIIELEKKNKIAEAYRKSLELIDHVYSELKLGEIVKKVDTVLLEKRREVITESHEKTNSIDMTLGFLSFLGLGGSGERDFKSWDVTDIITDNPEEKARFDVRKQTDYEDLKRSLESYISENEAYLVLLKEIGVYVMRLATILIDKGESYQVDIRDLTWAYKMTSDLYFSGDQVITRCIETSYTQKYYENTKTSYEKGFVFLPLSNSESGDDQEGNLFLPVKFEETVENSYQVSHHPYVEKVCEKSQVVTNKVSYEVNFSELEIFLKGWAKLAFGKKLFKFDHLDNFPHFGNSYFTGEFRFKVNKYIDFFLK